MASYDEKDTLNDTKTTCFKQSDGPEAVQRAITLFNKIEPYNVEREFHKNTTL